MNDEIHKNIEKTKNLLNSINTDDALEFSEWTKEKADLRYNGQLPELLKTKKVIFLIITLCGSIYVRLVLSNFIILPFTTIGVTLENSHINSSRCFRHSSNSSSCLIIFIFSTILSL